MKPLVDTDKSVDPTRKKNSIEVVSKRIQNEEARLDSTSCAISMVLCNATVSTTSSAEHISTEQPRDSLTSNFPQSIIRSMAKSKLVD